MPVVATIEYTRCDTYGSSLDYLTGWSKPGLAKASINIPRDMPPGDYDISVGYAGHRGYEMAPVSSKIRIDNPDEIPVSNLFYGVTDVNSSLFGSASNPIHGRGDIIKVTGKALSDGCIKPIAGLDVTGELQSSPGMSIASHAKTGRDGSFALTFQTYPQMESSDHSIRVRASYNNTGYETWVYNVRLRDLATFPFEVEGKRSAAQAMSNEAGKIVSVDLDAQLKKMTIVLDSKRDTQAQYEIAIPSELLSGDLVVTVLDGGQQAILTGDEYFADASGPVVDPVNDPRHIYSVSAFKRDGYAQVGFIDDVGGMRTIEIQGTTAIPEFGPMATLVLALFIAAATAIFGWRQANNPAL